FETASKKTKSKRIGTRFTTRAKPHRRFFTLVSGMRTVSSNPQIDNAIELNASAAPGRFLRRPQKPYLHDEPITASPTSQSYTSE
ncbi:hypothetical protein M569_09157, partial [Genlisea aurea]